MQVLDFDLPDFHRYSWSNDRAAATWQQRFDDIKFALNEVSITLVMQGLRPLGQINIDPERLEEWKSNLYAKGLQAKLIACNEVVNNGRKWDVGQLIFSKSKTTVEQYITAYKNSNSHVMGSLLGYPSCCTKHFTASVRSKSESDPTWTVAGNTEDFKMSKASQFEAIISTEEHLPTCNFVYHKLKLVPFFHIPCSFKCSETSRLASQSLRIGRQIGYSTEMDWLDEILRWPVEWTSLHGISEVKTPVFKLIFNGPAYANKLGLRLMGNEYPIFSEQGIKFPYKQPVKRKVTESTNFKRGLENQISNREVYHEDEH
ncbi:hypothetical protein BFP97_00770 [Roseivirga sp. 4D4]|uniref:DUF483 domain-containing protein n=1 Tax=Roseivirga sp. 4D4 TaxID=1889784 RepID=UPI000853D209|nr:DUF483 domain-containing protein [Roseivirga sp. 4D4]OEK00135.1 hypothetical protein BFP97_00770 [Roseivirga sp. 4D4]